MLLLVVMVIEYNAGELKRSYLDMCYVEAPFSREFYFLLHDTRILKL